MSATNLKAKGIKLRNGEKKTRDLVAIRINDWATPGVSLKEPLGKHNLVKFSVLTHNHGMGGRGKNLSSSFGTKMAVKLDRIEDNQKAVIEIWQAIFNELLPAMVDVDAITAVELFSAHLTGTATKEFEQINHEAAHDLYVTINKDYNSKGFSSFTEADKVNSELTEDERKTKGLDPTQYLNATATETWFQRNNERMEGRKDQPVADYKFVFPPPKFGPPPAKPRKGQFIRWNNTGINALSPCAWLRIHNHGWEYGPAFFKAIFAAVQQLAFKTTGIHSGQTQIDYLTEDLMMDPNHSLKVFFRLLQAHSEAQPYYPLQPSSQEVGSVFTDERKIQIVWNACYELFKPELTNMNTTRREDFNGSFNACKEQFLLAEMHRNEKLAVEDSKKPNVQPKNSAKDKVAWKNKGTGNEHKSNSNNSQPGNSACKFCNKNGHIAKHCFSNPDSSNYKGSSGKSKGSESNKKRKSGDMMSVEEYALKQDYKKYVEEHNNGSYDSE
jgi:hypothetical protein